MEELKKEYKLLKDKKKKLLDEMAHIQFKVDLLQEEIDKIKSQIKR